MEIDAAMAPIRTPAQLAHHISSVRDSPLDNLPPRARREFLDGLTFTPEGLGGFSHLPLASLGVDDAYRILQLFGMQGMISSIPNLFPKNETEIAILEVAVQPQASMPRWITAFASFTAVSASVGRTMDTTAQRRAMADSGLHCMRHLAGCLMALAITSSHARPPGDMYDRLAAVNATPGDDDKFRKLDALYRDDATQALGRLEALDAAELSKLFSATDMLAFYAQYEDREALMRYIQRMSAVYEELARRSIASEPQANAMLDALLGARLFDEARSLRESSAALLLDRDVPAVVFAPGFRSDDSAVLMLQPDGALLARNVDRTGSHLVAVVGCRASRRALDEINALPALVEALDRIPVFWLVPPDRMTDPGFLREWNARFPRQPAVFAYANAAWKGVAFQSMPRFQRFEGEQRVAQLVGWERSAGPSQLEPLL